MLIDGRKNTPIGRLDRLTQRRLVAVVGLCDRGIEKLHFLTVPFGFRDAYFACQQICPRQPFAIEITAWLDRCRLFAERTADSQGIPAD